MDPLSCSVADTPREVAAETAADKSSAEIRPLSDTVRDPARLTACDGAGELAPTANNTLVLDESEALISKSPVTQ